MSKFKGMWGMGLVLLVMIFLIFVFGFFGGALLRDAVTFKSRITFIVTAAADDRGSEIISIFNSDYDGKKYIELLGYKNLQNKSLFIESVKFLTDKLLRLSEHDGIKHQLILTGYNETIGKQPTTNVTYVADIPLPGGGRERVALASG